MDELNGMINDFKLLTTLFSNAPLTISNRDARDVIKYLTWLKAIGTICEQAFKAPETEDMLVYRAQALANIFAIFQYDGKTLKEDEGK